MTDQQSLAIQYKVKQRHLISLLCLQTLLRSMLFTCYHMFYGSRYAKVGDVAPTRKSQTLSYKSCQCVHIILVLA